jgi:hypothetical protein
MLTLPLIGSFIGAISDTSTIDLTPEISEEINVTLNNDIDWGKSIYVMMTNDTVSN